MVARRPVFSALGIISQTASPLGLARGNYCPSPANDIPARLCAGQFLPFSRKRHPRQVPRGAIIVLLPQTASPPDSARDNSCPSPANDIPDRLCAGRPPPANGIPARSRAGQFLPFSRKRHPRQALRGAILALLPQTTSPLSPARGNSCSLLTNGIPARRRAGQFLSFSRKRHPRQTLRGTILALLPQTTSPTGSARGGDWMFHMS